MKWRFWNKTGQEEMVGFVIIVVLVVVIAVIVLGISLRNNQKESIESAEIDSFLSSINDFTTECQIPEGNPLPISQLIVMCNEKKDCSSGEDSCDVLEQTLSEIMENSAFVVSESLGLYYYRVSVYEEFEGVERGLIEPIFESVNELTSCPGASLYNDRAIGDAYLKVELCRGN